MTTQKSPDRAACLNDLSACSFNQYEREGRLNDLNRAIEYVQDAVYLTPKVTPSRPRVLNNLNAGLFTRYRRGGKLNDFNQAIEYSRDADNLASEGYSGRAYCLNNLSNCLSMRYELEGKLDDLSDAIVPVGNSIRADFLNSLSRILVELYKRQGNLDHLNQAIEHSRDAVSLAPEVNANQAYCLNNLSNWLSIRYESEGRLDDLNEVIDYWQDRVRLTPESDPNRPSCLSNLAHSFNLRYQREGKLDDLNQAIRYIQGAVNLTTEKNPERAGHLINLSNCLVMRFRNEGKLDDLIRAIEYIRNAINMTSEWSSIRATCLNDLSACFINLYEREGRLNDLNQAIEYVQDAVYSTPESDPSRAIFLSNLSASLIMRFMNEGMLDDLNDAIECNQKAIDLTPEESPDRAGRLNNLSRCFIERYKRGRKLNDLHRSIEYSQIAIKLTPKGNPDRAAFFISLSHRFGMQFKREGKLNDLNQTLESCRQAWKSTNSPPSMRLLGCQQATDLLILLRRWNKAKALLAEGYEIFPFLISHMTSKFDQENMIKSISGMAATGCALSLYYNEDKYNTIKILELGRGIISRLTINSKSDLSALHQQHPNLAKRFEDLKYIINFPSSDREGTFGSNLLAIDLKDLLSEIRREKGFEDFQDLPSKGKLLDTAAGETKVLLNATIFRTDAIMVTANGCIRTLSLNPSIFNDAKYYYSQLRNRFGYDGTNKAWDRANRGMLKFLKWLWDFVVGPICDALYLEPSGIYEQEPLSFEDEIARLTYSSATQSSRSLNTDRLAILRTLMERYRSSTSSPHAHFRTSRQNRSRSSNSMKISSLPRIHWIGVGFLGMFPFHAAGYGLKDPVRNTMNYAISSYAANLTTLSFAKSKPMTLAAHHSRLLLVTMPHTPAQNFLPGVEKEAKIIQDIVGNYIAVKLLEMPLVQTVLDDLPFHDIVHFACHGYADPMSPLRSGLLLRGDEPGKAFYKNIRNSALTVERMSSMDMSESQLAFLSACCTAENASSTLMDEGIHLANGFQLTGFPHVIASLWEADDELSVAMTEVFYKTIFENDWNGVNGHRRIAYALHEAVLAARQICKDPLAWATIVHFGP